MNKDRIKKDLQFKPTAIIPPGETLLEIINSLNITQAELARRMDRPLKLVNEIIKGKTAITPETALQLEQVLGKPASFWVNLEAVYQELKARQQMESQLIGMTDESKKYPYSEMARLGWVPKTKNLIQKVLYLLRFFSVTAFKDIVEKQEFKVALSISAKHRHSLPAVYAWLRQGVRETEKVEVRDFSKELLKDSIQDIRKLTLERPEIFIPKLKQVFANCGVIFVIIPSLPNAPIFGSKRWMSPTRALIQMSIRLKWIDTFWFHLFHEIGHLLFDNKKDSSVDFLENNHQSDSEKKVTAFARDTLIPPAIYQEIIREKHKSIEPLRDAYSIAKKWAVKLGIHPGIIVGRLQHEEELPKNFNRLREKFSDNILKSTI